MTPDAEYEYVIVGGGLQGCLLAHSLGYHRPTDRVLLIERSDELCGNHTWSFHSSDVSESARPWFESLVVHRWPGYCVKFPGYERRVGIPYATIPSTALCSSTQSLRQRPRMDYGMPLAVLCGAACTIDSPNQVTLSTGEQVHVGVVIDCRGLHGRGATPTGCGFQSFLGLEVETEETWPATEPTVMDVRADQLHGFEFLYELPLGPRRVLLEFTQFRDTPVIDEARAKQRIDQRLEEAGVRSRGVVRTERGCLPMPYERQPSPSDPVVRGGYAGGWYHAATGYSVPMAVRFADAVARSEPRNIASKIASLASQDATRRCFARFLNRLLFRLVDPAHRWQVFRRFYRVLPEPRIARFYSHRFTIADATRIVVGIPPTGLAPIRFARSLLSTSKASLP